MEDIEGETIFGYTLGIKVLGAEAQMEEHSLHFSSSKKYAVAIANPSRLTDRDTKGTCLRMLSAPFIDFAEQTEKFWSDFWETSYIVDHSDAGDYLENIYYLSKYILACGMSGKFPLHFNTGVFRNEGDGDITWAVGYWWYNQRCLYGWLNACGNSERWKPMFALYLDHLEKMCADTRKKYPESDGVVVAETLCWDGRRTFSENSPVAEFINCSGAEIALKMFEYCDFTCDVSFLYEKVLPFAKKVLDFTISHELTKSDGVYGIPAGISNARETYVHIADPITSMGALRALLPKTIAAMERSGEDAGRYKDVLENLADFHFGGFPKRFLAGKDGLDHPRTNFDDPCLELVYPYGLLGNGKPYYTEIVNNYMNRIGRDEILLTLGWDNSPIWAARLGLSDNVRTSLRWLTAKTQIYENGIGYDGNCKYEFSGNAITSFNECLLQSYDGIIRVFPAVCQAEKGGDVRFKLHASGGFVVESEFDFARFQAKYVKIYSLRGGVCRIYNPYGAGRKALLRCGRKELFFADELIEFHTEAGQDYFMTLAKQPVFETQSPESYCNRKAKKLYAFGFSRKIGKTQKLL